MRNPNDAPSLALVTIVAALAVAEVDGVATVVEVVVLPDAW